MGPGPNPTMKRLPNQIQNIANSSASWLCKDFTHILNNLNVSAFLFSSLVLFQSNLCRMYSLCAILLAFFSSYINYLLSFKFAQSLTTSFLEKDSFRLLSKYMISLKGQYQNSSIAIRQLLLTPVNSLLSINRLSCFTYVPSSSH